MGATGLALVYAVVHPDNAVFIRVLENDGV
jgi:hypothetical protein